MWQVVTLRSAYECLQESVAQREMHEEEEKAGLQREVEALRATNARQATQTVSPNQCSCLLCFAPFCICLYL